MIRTRENAIHHHLDSFKNFEKFFDSSPDLLCVAGYDGYFKRINPAVSKLLGYSIEELMSKPINDFVYNADKNTTEEVRNELRNKISLFNFENRYLTKDGSIVWLLWTSLPIEEDHLVYAVAKNITYKKELEEERKSHITGLTRINNEFKQLTYSTAHDLRSPVDNILSVFELLDVSTITDVETIEYIAIIKSTTESLKQTLNEYVSLLNTKNTINAQIEEIDFNESLNEVLLSINSLIQNSQANIEIDFSVAPKVNFNRAYLKSIFLNLITNSIKYAKSNELIKIKIHSEYKNNRTQLIIADNGKGFDMDKVKDRVFGLHQKFGKNIDSNGIGLYLVHNHVTNLGGRIILESKPDEGAKFTISFRE